MIGPRSALPRWCWLLPYFGVDHAVQRTVTGVSSEFRVLNPMINWELGDQSEMVMPIDRAVPAMIFDAASMSLAFRSTCLRVAISRS